MDDGGYGLVDRGDHGETEGGHLPLAGWCKRASSLPSIRHWKNVIGAVVRLGMNRMKISHAERMADRDSEPWSLEASAWGVNCNRTWRNVRDGLHGPDEARLAHQLREGMSSFRPYQSPRLSHGEGHGISLDCLDLQPCISNSVFRFLIFRFPVPRFAGFDVVCGSPS
jgi:hypothetical protein